MFILARGGQSYARLRFHVGPGGDIAIPVSTDYSRPFAASDHAAWQAEFLANVEEELSAFSNPQDAKKPADFAHNGPFEPLDAFGADAEWLDWPPGRLEEFLDY
jgi:hypothetical protein